MVVDVRGVSNRPGRAGTAAQPVTRGARRAVSSVVGIRSNYFLRFKPEKPLQFIVIDMLMGPLCNLGRLIHGCYFSGLQRFVGGGKASSGGFSCKPFKKNKSCVKCLPAGNEFRYLCMDATECFLWNASLIQAPNHGLQSYEL